MHVIHTQWIHCGSRRGGGQNILLKCDISVFVNCNKLVGMQMVGREKEERNAPEKLVAKTAKVVCLLYKLCKCITLSLGVLELNKTKIRLGYSA